MKITPSGVFLGLAIFLFLCAAVFLAAILTYTCCGVSFFSPQVGWKNRAMALLLPGVCGATGVILLVGRRAVRNP